MSKSDPAFPAVRIREPGRSDLYVLIVEPIYLGRGCSGILVDDAQVSRQHLELWPVGNMVAIRDCGSSHGTTLDGSIITEVSLIAPGSIARCGNVAIELVEERAEKAVDDLSQQNTLAPRSSIEQVAELVDIATPVVSINARSDRTLTIVFSDIEGSTEFATRVGDTRWFEILSAHNALLRKCIAARGGTEVKSYGDGFMLTFDSARSAIDALIEFQQALAADDAILEQIRVRAGAHVGEAIFDQGGDLFGQHVNIAARIAAAATADEILVSPLVREIVEARGDLVFGPSRTVALKGVSDAYVVHPVAWQEQV